MHDLLTYFIEASYVVAYTSQYAMKLYKYVPLYYILYCIGLPDYTYSSVPRLCPRVVCKSFWMSTLFINAIYVKAACTFIASRAISCRRYDISNCL